MNPNPRGEYRYYLHDKPWVGLVREHADGKLEHLGPYAYSGLAATSV